LKGLAKQKIELAGKIFGGSFATSREYTHRCKIQDNKGDNMKVLQTLGKSRAQEGIFQYRRDADGVYIDGSVGNAKGLDPSEIIIQHSEWRKILRTIQKAEYGTFRLTGTSQSDEPPYQSLYELLSDAVFSPEEGCTSNDSWKSYVCAILGHEGSIDLYGGGLGQGKSAIICLAKNK
jgi:hypothetical protein